MKRKKIKKKVTTRGLLRMHPRGFGFVIPEDKTNYQEDIFIPKQMTKGAVDGDTVEIEINTENPSPKGLDGKIIAIIKRGRSHLGGTIVAIINKKGAYAHVPLLGPNAKMRILPSEERAFNLGDRIVIHILDWGSETREGTGEMASYIGHIDDPASDIPAVIEEFDLEASFSTKLIEEAENFGKKVTSKDIKGRLDLRDLECFTIDPDTAKDFDDALSLTKDESGNFHLGVHIADVSHYVKPGSQIDVEAKERCNSVYFPGKVLPMLPEALSNELCSLKPNVDRLTASVLVTFDPNGNLIDYKIARAVIHSNYRFSYKEAKEVLDGKKKNRHLPTLKLMCDLCYLLKKKRFERGSIEFALKSLEIIVDEKGIPKYFETVEYDITHQLVEEFMLKANELVATYLTEKGMPLPYRVHEIPSVEDFKEFIALARSFGFELSSEPTNSELQELFIKAEKSDVGGFLAASFIKSMKLAQYSTHNVGHYGLGLKYYTHFTSPIRRYVDFVVHRLLFEKLEADQNFDEIARACSEKERLSARAENSVIKMKKLRLLTEEKESHPEKQYDAIVTQVKSFGIVFEILSCDLEGFLPLSQLTDDYFLFDEEKRRLKGKRHGSVIEIGTKLQVKLLETNFLTQEAKWGWIASNKKK